MLKYSAKNLADLAEYFDWLAWRACESAKTRKRGNARIHDIGASAAYRNAAEIIRNTTLETNEAP